MFYFYYLLTGQVFADSPCYGNRKGMDATADNNPLKDQIWLQTLNIDFHHIIK